MSPELSSNASFLLIDFLATILKHLDSENYISKYLLQRHIFQLAPSAQESNLATFPLYAVWILFGQNIQT